MGQGCRGMGIIKVHSAKTGGNVIHLKSLLGAKYTHIEKIFRIYIYLI